MPLPYSLPFEVSSPVPDTPAALMTAAQFAEIEHQLLDRRWSYLSRRVPQPLIRLWDKEMRLIARIVIPESWDCEEIAYDAGSAQIEIVGKDNNWLREIVCFKTRPEEDLHLTIDPDPDKPHDYKNRWGGKVETIEDDETQGVATRTVLNCVSNIKHLSKIMIAATPLLPPAFQPIKMFLWAMPCASLCATTVFVNLARIYALNSFWPIPRDIWNPQQMLTNALDWRSWPVQVMPINTALDQSRWATVAARWKDAKTVLTPIMKDCGIVPHAYTWIPGDPAPYSEVYGKALGEILKPTRACVILSFEDQSGVTGPTGSAADGLINLFAVTADDLITETLIAVDGDGDGETDPFIRKILLVAPKRPPFVYRDTGYGGTNSRKMVIHKSQAISIVVGGRSPAWVNQAITFAIRYGLSQLAQVINYGLGAYQQYGTEGLDNLYQGQLDDTVLAFMNFIDPRRSSAVGSYAYNEHFQQGSGTAFTVNSIQDIRAGWYATRPYTSFKFDVGDGAPYVLGEDIRLGSRVSAERRKVIYTDQIMAIKRGGDRSSSGRPVISFGDDSQEEDPVAQAFTTIGNVANFAAMMAGGGDMF